MIRKILILSMLAGVFSAHAQVEVFQGFVLDTLTTTQLDALPSKVKIKGAHFYNKDVSSLVSWDGTAWVTIGGTIPDGSITESKLNTSVNASLDLADSSVQPSDNISTLTNDAGYVTTAGDLWSDPVDADIVPDGLTRSLGSSTNYFVNAFLDNIRAYTPNPIIDMRDTNNANNEGFRFGPSANGQDFLLEFLDDLNGVTSTYTINASGTPSAATDLIDLDYFQNNAGTDDQTLSLGGTGNKDLTISGTGGNTVTLPVLQNSNQILGTADRVIDIDPTGSLAVTRGQSRRLLIDGNGNTELLLPSDPYDAGWDGLFQPASKADVYTKIESLVASTYPATANQKLVTYHTNKVTVHDSMFTAANLYLGRDYIFTATDTLELGNDVTSNNYNKYLNFMAMDLDGTGADSLTVRPVDGNRILFAGNASLSPANNNFIIKKNELGMARKINDSVWVVSAIDLYDGVPVAEVTDAIMATSPEFFYSPETIDPDAVSDADAISGANAWTDASGNGHDLTIGSGTFELNVQAGVGRQVRWTSSGYFDVPDVASLDVVPGTDEFTMMFRVGETLNPDGSGYAIGKAPTTSSLRTGMYFNAPGGLSILIGGTGITLTPDTFSANSLIIATVSTTVVNVWVDGVQIATDQPIGTGDPTGQSWNIGGRSDGSYLAGIGYTCDMVAMTKKVISTAERQAIEAQYQINP